MNGKVLGLTDIDTRGGDLVAPVAATDTVLFVRDTADFEEFEEPSDNTYWLTIAGSAPKQYVALDHDASTVTLAAPAGAVYEAGDPIVLWDPDVPPAGAQVAEYTVAVATSRGSVPAVIDYQKIPTAGTGRLIGASVTLDEDENGDLYVDRVLGRKSGIDQSYIDVPLLILYLPANQGIPSDGTNFTTLTGWSVKKSTDDDLFTVNAGTGEVTVNEDGVYGLFPASVWVGNSSGKRSIQPVTNFAGVDEILTTVPGSPPDAVQYSQRLSMPWPLVAGTKIRVEVQQTSGATLDVRGGTGGRFTQFALVRWQA